MKRSRLLRGFLGVLSLVGIEKFPQKVKCQLSFELRVEIIYAKEEGYVVTRIGHNSCKRLTCKGVQKVIENVKWQRAIGRAAWHVSEDIGKT